MESKDGTVRNNNKGKSKNRGEMKTIQGKRFSNRMNRFSLFSFYKENLLPVQRIGDYSFRGHSIQR